MVRGFQNVARNLRGQGFEVKEVPGWENRGKGVLAPRGAMNHHTAGSLRGGRTASLRVCTFGREGLRNALCNWYTERGENAVAWIVAAGLAWHAGKKGTSKWRTLTGNSVVIGKEHENNGRGERYHEDAVELQVALDVELAREFGYSPELIPDHKEWAPQRKPDRFGVDPELWRKIVRDTLEEPESPSLGVQERLDDMLFVRRSDQPTVYLYTNEGLIPLPKAVFNKLTGGDHKRVVVLSPSHALFQKPILAAAVA